MLPLVSLPNDVWETSAEILYWWHVATQIWVVVLIGRAAWEIWFNQSDIIWQETSGSITKYRLFSQAKKSSSETFDFVTSLYLD